MNLENSHQNLKITTSIFLNDAYVFFFFKVKVENNVYLETVPNLYVSTKLLRISVCRVNQYSSKVNENKFNRCFLFLLSETERSLVLPSFTYCSNYDYIFLLNGGCEKHLNFAWKYLRKINKHTTKLYTIVKRPPSLAMLVFSKWKMRN